MQRPSCQAKDVGHKFPIVKEPRRTMDIELTVAVHPEEVYNRSTEYCTDQVSTEGVFGVIS